TDRPVNLAAGESFTLAHASFALDKTAGNASAGIGVLAVVNRERKEVDALAGLGIGGSGGENNVFAESDDGSAAGLLGKFSGFDRELFSACEFDGNFCGFRLHRSSFLSDRRWGRRACGQRGVRVDRRMPGGGWERTLLRLSRWNRPHTEPVALLLADAELGNNGLVPFRVVLLQVVEQATAPADHHEKSAARAVVFL